MARWERATMMCVFSFYLCCGSVFGEYPVDLVWTVCGLAARVLGVTFFLVLFLSGSNVFSYNANCNFEK